MSSRVFAKDVEFESPANDLEASEVQVSPTESEQFEFGVDYGERKVNIVGMIANTCNTIVGAGILALPSSIAATGYGTGTILFILGAAFSQLGLHLLFKVMNEFRGDQLSFGRVAGHISPYLSFLASFLVWLICFAVATLYLTVTANFLVPVAAYFAPNASPDAWYMQRTFWLTIPFLILGAPLSVPKKVGVLQYTSALAMLFILYTAVIVVLYAFKPVDELCENFLTENNVPACVGPNCCVSNATDALCCIGSTTAFTSSVTKFFTTFPVIITAFCCSPQAFAFYNDLINPTVKRLDTATLTALVLVTLLYFTISFAGYFTYGSSVSSDLLGSYPLTLEVTLARLGVAFLTTVSYPLLLQPCRDSFLRMLSFPIKHFSGNDLHDPRSKAYRITFYVSLVLMLAFTYALGLLGLNITFLLNLGGSLSVANLSFTLPGIFYLQTFRGRTSMPLRLSSWVLIFLGISLMLINIILWILGYE